MVKHTQTIRRLLPTNCLSVFDHFVKLALKVTSSYKYQSVCNIHQRYIIPWFHENKMIVNPDKFQATVLDKRKSNNTEVKFIIGSEQIQAVPSVEILGITILILT